MFLEGKSLELLLAAIFALVVVGPKDLPILLRRLGKFMAKLRGMAAEFRASFDEMARQSELDDLRKEVQALRAVQLGDAAVHAELNETVTQIHQDLSNAGVHIDGAGYTPALEPPAPEPAPAPKPRTRKPAAAKSAKAPAKAGASRKAPAKSRSKAVKP